MSLLTWKQQMSLQKFADSSNKDGKKDVWYYSQRFLLCQLLILYVKLELHPTKRNMSGIVDFQNHGEADSDDEESELVQSLFTPRY